MVSDIASLILGYLLGSIPSAYIIGRIWGKIDLREEGDGHISATATYRRVGRPAFITVLIMDMGKAAAVIYLTRLMSDSNLVLLAAGCAAVAGHCWSVFLRFQGGLGALVIMALTLVVAPKEFLVAGVVTVLVMLVTRKSSLGTIVLAALTSLTLLVERQDLLIVIFPSCLVLIQILKRFQIGRSGVPSAYKNELFEDLKRSRRQ